MKSHSSGRWSRLADSIEWVVVVDARSTGAASRRGRLREVADSPTQFKDVAADELHDGHSTLSMPVFNNRNNRPNTQLAAMPIMLTT